MPGTRFPAFFVSHGAPTLPIDEGSPSKAFLEALGHEIEREFGRPKAILLASAHWETKQPTVGGAVEPKTIYDFFGFPKPLYELTYPAKGDPDLAERIRDELKQAGFEAATDLDRGLDHGTWTPLLLMWPKADIPALQMSVQPHLGPKHHMDLGAALRHLREEGILVIGSGAATHALQEFRGQAPDAETPDWVAAFADWLAEKVAANDIDALLAYENGPEGRRNHPSPEHFLPLFIPMGAGPPGIPGNPIHRSYRHGIIGMDCYRFD